MNMNGQPQSQQDDYRPPSLSIAIAFGAFFLTLWLYSLGDRGVEWGPFLSLFTGGYGALQVIKALNDWDKLRDWRRRHGQFEQAAKERHSARLGTFQDIDSSEDFR